MRTLLPLLLLSTFSFGQWTGGDTRGNQPCDEYNGLKVTKWDVVPDDYTGTAFLCEDGKIKGSCGYKDGKKDGLETTWHDNGQVWTEMNYKEGKIIDDYVLFYNKDGAAYITVYFQDGLQVRCEGDCD